MNDLLSDNRIIIALDTPTAQEASKIVKRIGDASHFYKVGLELFAAGEGMPLVKELIQTGNEVFVDLKLLDIPTTVARAAKRVSACGARFQTVHAQDDALTAAVDASANAGILAVTLLTSVGPSQLAAQGYKGSVTEYVVDKSCRAIELGCAGVVCSPKEAKRVRAAIGPGPAIVTPGIRASASDRQDQARSATIDDAFRDGASHVVVGRPVRDAPDPQAAVLELIKAAN